MLPCNVAAIAIAAIFYAWRDMYLPRRNRNQAASERVAHLMWSAAAKTESDHRPPAVLEHHMTEEPQEAAVNWVEEPEPAFTLYRNVECRACGGNHTFHSEGGPRPTGSTFEFTCPAVNKVAWIWWLDQSEPVEAVPSDSVSLKRIAG